MQRKLKEIPYSINVADSFFKRLKGLMFRKDPITNEGLWIMPCNAVHMFFMRFPLDIVLLNKENEVVKLYPSLRPWRITMPAGAAHSTLELPEGAIEELKISIGDVIHCSSLE